MNNQWSDKLRKRMEVHEEQAPDGLWNDIEQIMLLETLVEPAVKQNVILLWGKRISAAAAILLLALSIGYMFWDNNQLEIQMVEEVPQEKLSSPIKPLVADNETTPYIVDSVEVDKTKLLPIGKSMSKRIDTASVSTPVYSDAGDLSSVSEESSNVEEPKENLDNHKSHPRPKVESLATEPDFVFNELPKENKSGWATNIYASNIVPQSNNKYSGYNNLSSYVMEQHDTDAKLAMAGNAYGNILLANQYEEVYTDIKHNQPVSVGLSADYNINDRWSLRSGLIYTYLSSKLHSGSDNNYYSSNQSLHYVGIPLNVNFNVWKNKKLALYVSGGGLAEKNISGKLTTDYVVDNKVLHTKKSNVKIDQLQWSANASVGAQYNFSDRVGLYFEPGVSYYFENAKSEIETIYKEKPWNLSLRLGLSFSLGK